MPGRIGLDHEIRPTQGFHRRGKCGTNEYQAVISLLLSTGYQNDAATLSPIIAGIFTWGDFPVVGISFDICGAVILAWSFSAKTPWRIREEIPRAVSGSGSFDPDFV